MGTGGAMTLEKGQGPRKQNKTRHKVASFENLCFSADKAPFTHPFLPAMVAAMGLAPFPTEHPCLLLSLAPTHNLFKCLIENYIPLYVLNQALL